MEHMRKQVELFPKSKLRFLVTSGWNWKAIDSYLSKRGNGLRFP